MAKVGDLVSVSLQAGIYQFLLGIFALGMLAALVMYADARSRWKRFGMGLVHWIAHLAAMVTLYWVVNHYGFWQWFGGWTETVARPVLGENYLVLRTASYMAQMIFGGGLVAGFVWGLYLFVACAFFRRHTNDGFSSMRIPDFKNFLRIKIEPERLTIYPIGLMRAPTRLEWKRTGAKPERYVSRLPMTPELIDGPIVIEAAGVRPRPGAPTGVA